MSRLLSEAQQGLLALQQVQTVYDAAMWGIEDPKHAKLRHIHIHLSITVGKLARLLEPEDHIAHRGEQSDTVALTDDLYPVIADLLMHASQIANLLDADLGTMMRRRYKSNAARFAPDSPFSSL